MFLELVSACCFSKRIRNLYYIFTLTVLYTERRGIPSLSHKLGAVKFTVFSMSNLRFYALYTQSALHLAVMLDLL